MAENRGHGPGVRRGARGAHGRDPRRTLATSVKLDALEAADTIPALDGSVATSSQTRAHRNLPHDPVAYDSHTA